MRKINDLYQFICELREKKGRKLKIVCDWDEVLKSRESTTYYIMACRPYAFADFLQNFWENASVEYKGYSCKILNTNLEEVERIREKNPKEFLEKSKEISKSSKLYDEAPWLSIAEDLLKVLKEDLVDYFVITGNYEKGRHDEINVDETLGGDIRKIKKFRDSFAKLPNTKLKVNAPFLSTQGEVQLSRPEWIKNNCPDFDIFIDDNPNNISGTREIFSSDSNKIYIFPDYRTNKNVQGENIFRVSIHPTSLKDEDFFYQERGNKSIELGLDVKKVYLGGTCNNSTWREELIPRLDPLKVSFSNLVVEKWVPVCQEKEMEEKKASDFLLYVITKEMLGFYSIAEVVDDSNKSPEKTIFCYLEEGFGQHQVKSLKAIANLVKSNGAKVFVSLDEVINYLNNNEQPEAKVQVLPRTEKY